MDIKNILIEHWSRLQCANFFISFTEPFTAVASVSIDVQSNQIQIKYADNCVDIDTSNYFKLKTQSLSLLIIKANYLSFRLNTNDFDVEVLDTSTCVSSSIGPNHLEPNVVANDTVTIICENCTAPITDSVMFNRVLELPSENLDIDDWYCHKHNNIQSSDTVSCSKEKTYNFTKFSPRSLDLLYGSFFCLIHLEQLKNIKLGNYFVHCKRCLNHIGNVVQKTSIKLWNENVKFESCQNNNASATSAYHLFGSKKTQIIENVWFLIDKLIYDFDFIASTIHSSSLPQPSIKILFESVDARKNTKYLFVQVMNRDLEMYKNDERTPNGLVRCAGLKVLYRLENDSNRPIIQFWQNDATVTSLEISVKMFNITVETLIANSKLVPECYRSNGGFMLGYLFRL